MEWTMTVNEMLRDDITKLNHTLIPPGYHGDMRTVRMVQESLSRLIDWLGEQSSLAQGLNKVITTADKLRNSPTHYLYLLKDAYAKDGQGEVIGMLKVGVKHLFLFTAGGRVREVDPVCVLDFFVVRDRQRHGHGRRLFDRMLHDLALSPHQLAVDGPSAKMEHFLHKNYAVAHLMRQNNNFAISDRFFDNYPPTPGSSRSVGSASPSPSVSMDMEAAGAAVGRFTAHQPASSIGAVIHGGDYHHYEHSNGFPNFRRANNMF